MPNKWKQEYQFIYSDGTSSDFSHYNSLDSHGVWVAQKIDPATQRIASVEILYQIETGRVYGIRFLDDSSQTLISVGEILDETWRSLDKNKLYKLHLAPDERLIGTVSNSGLESKANHYGLRFIMGRAKDKYLPLQD